MKKATVKMFFDELEKQPELQAKFNAELMPSLSRCEQMVMPQIIMFGSAQGYEFDHNDLTVFFKTTPSSFSGELNDEELASAGGGAFWIVICGISLAVAALACCAGGLALTFIAVCDGIKTFGQK